MEEHFQHFHFTNPYLNIPSPIPPPIPPPHQLPPLLPPPPVQSEPVDRERLPQWTHTETAEFLSIRADLDASFMSTKRNKPLWEAISARLQQKGFSRTPDQCKSKWKNLVTRFKGSEAMDDAGKQFPFYEEMRTIFSRRIDRSLAIEKKKGKGVQGEGKEWMNEDDEEEEEEEEEEDDEYEQNVLEEKGKKKRKMTYKRRGIEWEVKLALHAIVKQQMEMQTKWVKESEAREAERREKEEKWRRTMISLCEERLALTRRWREREDERSARAEARAERQDSLITAILAKLSEDER